MSTHHKKASYGPVNWTGTRRLEDAQIEAVIRNCSLKYLLLKILHILKEHTCVRVSF